MAVGTRLFKIASEINIGKDAIVEFLQQKGFELENKPVAFLTPEMADLVYDKFKREKKAAEIQREKVEKHKIRKEPRKKDDGSDIEESHEEHNVVHVEKLPEEPKPVIADTPVQSEPVITTPPVELEIPIVVIEEIPTVEVPKTHQLTELGKIPLDELERRMDGGKKSGPFKKGKQEQEDRRPNRDKKSGSRPKQEIKMQELPAINSDIKKVELTFKKDRTFAEPILESANQELISEVDDSAIDETLVGAPVELDENGDPIDSDLSSKAKKKKRRKRKKLAEVEVEVGTTPKLKGLTIVGRIDLNKDKVRPANILDSKPRKDKKKVGDIEEEDEDGKLKSKFKSLPKKGKVKDKIVDKKKKKKVSIRELIKVEDIDKAIKNTLAEIGESSHTSQRAKLRQKKKVEREEKEQKKTEELELEATVLRLTEFVTTGALADLMGVSPNEIILKCMGLGLMVTINQRLDKDTITLIADDYGFTVDFIDVKTLQSIQAEDVADSEEDLKFRSPIVTVMGHVDHGKTSLLDWVRKANVIAGEAGGITQHIGAYRVELANGKHITFLDTPGHEAFTAMRARGAQVTDIVVLVVAADDSVMPQTIEAISHAKAANVPIVVAINKVDKPSANIDKIKQQLADYDVLIEEWGGKHQHAEISAKFGQNVDVLLEKILLEAEFLNLKANPDRKARGTVIEANMDKGLGTVTTVIIQKGTLRIGDPFVAGVYSGRVRAMFDERDHKIEEAGPSIPVRVIGIDGLPEAGDIISVIETDVEARLIANERQQMKREQEFRATKHVTLDELSQQIAIGGVKDLNLIIKTDVSGSVEALSDSLFKQSTEEVRVNILHKGVGNITETDVMLAMASNAVIIGFQISPSSKARKLAEKESVDIRLYNIIYDAINDVRLALEGLLTPDMKEDITASIEVRQVFRISKMGSIAGCYVLSGKITRNDRVRVLRDGLAVYNGTLHSLKRNKDDVKEVDTGYECGIMLDGFNEFEEGDIIEGFKQTEVKRFLTQN
jgi:translation initiation factor IF-2